jgi:outer membrane protein assembly factor BamB
MWLAAKRARSVAILLALSCVAVLFGCGSSATDEHLNFKGSGYPGGDAVNTRRVGGPIDSATAPGLKVAWTRSLTAGSTYGTYASIPIISRGVIYSQDLASNVEAISLETGAVQWSHSYEEPDQGPNGLVVQEGNVFGATASKAFALDQKTGKELWSTKLTRSSNEGIDMAPGYHEGLVYVSTVPLNASSEYPGGGVGILWALDAKTGKKVWHFNTVPEDLWGNSKVNSGGGLWYAPAFDQHGYMYFGTGNPAPFPGTADHPWGASRPGPDLYTDSLVKLDAKTGKLLWYYQQTPHDIYDWDFQDPPILIDSGGRELAIGAGKSGVVVALDAQTGKPVWKRPVGTHNGHDDDGLYAMRGEYDRLKTDADVYPGLLGGVLAPMATDGKALFVPVVNHRLTVLTPSEFTEPGETGGEMVAIDVASGAIKWTMKSAGPVYGGPLVVNDVVFFTTFDGAVHGLAADSGKQVWKAQMSAASNSGVAVSGKTLVAVAGLETEDGQQAEMVAYRLGG